MTLGPLARRCRAHNRFGDPCGLAPIHGGTVCQVHGGRAPQVKAAAARRVGDLYPQALRALERLVDDPDADRRAAVAAAKIIVEYHEGKPTEHIEAKILSLSELTLRIDRGDDDDR